MRDAFANRIVGWATDPRKTTTLLLAAINHALRSLDRPEWWTKLQIKRRQTDQPAVDTPPLAGGRKINYRPPGDAG